jgi:DNA replication protein DnaD
MPNITTRINREIEQARKRDQQRDQTQQGQQEQPKPKDNFGDWLNIGPDIGFDDED